MKNKSILSVVFIGVFVAGSLSGQWLSQRQPIDAWAADASPLPLQQLQELSEVFTMIKNNHVEEVPQEKIMENAIRGMVSALDPHSSYLNENDLTGFNRDMTGEQYGGVGTYIGKRDNFVEVVSPIYNTPAYRAGIESGDLLLKIDGVTTQGMELDEAVNRMRGKAGDVIVLEVLPVNGGEPRTVELVREVITTPSVMSSLLDNGYGYLRITRFQAETTKDLVGNLNGMYAENGGPLKGLVLDLRHNPGGFLHSSIAVASVFLPFGTTVVSDKGRAATHIFKSQGELYADLKNDNHWKTLPMVMLVNNGSASASEILAGALQDHRRAVIIGTRTYGKASVQNITPLQSSGGKTALRLTIARYLTPLGRDIQARGIEPDIVVNQLKKVEEEKEGLVFRESDAPRHLENSGENEKSKQSNRPAFIDENDFQYNQAMVILKALRIAAAKQ